MRQYFLFFTSIFICSVAFCQNSVKGRLFDKEQNSEVPYGFITIYNSEVVVSTGEPDVEGYFLLTGVKDGDYSIEINVAGYEILNSNITVKGDLELGVINLKTSTFEVEGIEVVGRKHQTVYKLDKKIISASSDLVSSAGGTATDVLSKVPSVRIDSDGGLTFRGSSNFVVQVNGKPSMFTGDQALQQIPASLIENIEIITTPSVRDQSDGDAGIINIITKKSYKDGFSGVVNGYGSTMGSRGADFALSKRSGEHQINVVGSYNQQLLRSDFEQAKTTLDVDDQVTSYSEGDRVGDYSNYMLQLEWVYDREKTNYNLNLFGGYMSKKRMGDLDYMEISSDDTILAENYTNNDFYENRETIYGFNSGFEHKFNEEGHKIDGYFYTKYGANALESFKSDLYNASLEREHGHEAWEAEYRLTLRGDLNYTYPYSKSGQLESGYSYNSYTEDGDYTMVYWDPDIQDFYYRDDIYNTFVFKRDIHSLYLLLKQSIGKFDLQAGLRGEYYFEYLRSSIEGADRSRTGFDFFPSLHLGYETSSNSNISASYSHRINRPVLFYMEPYVTFRDYYTAEIGNPDIRPEYIDSYEISYVHEFGNSTFQVGAFHRYREDKIERLRVTYQAGITLDSMANVGNDYSTGLEASVNLKVSKLWSFMVNGSGYFYKLKNKVPELGGSDESSINCSFAMSNTFNVAKNTTLQLDGNYVGASVTTQGDEEAYFYADFALRQKFFEGRLSADLTFKNFLNTAKYVSDITTSTLSSYTTILPKYPVITLGVSYLFNNFTGNRSKNSDAGIFEGTNY